MRQQSYERVLQNCAIKTGIDYWLRKNYCRYGNWPTCVKRDQSCVGISTHYLSSKTGNKNVYAAGPILGSQKNYYLQADSKKWTQNFQYRPGNVE